MVEGLAERATERQARLLGVIQRLDDDALRARVQRSHRDNQRTIKEWQEFAATLDRAHRAMRESRRGTGR